MEALIMEKFSNNFNEGSKALLEAIFSEDKKLNDQIDACLADFDVPEDYTPYWITRTELNSLSSDTFVERVNGKLTVYRNLAKVGFDAYVTKDEVSNNPTIRGAAAEYLEMIDKYHYQLVEFEDEKFVRVMGRDASPDPRNIIMTNVFRNMMQERYGDSAYVITTARGALFVFGANEDPLNILKDILFSELGLLDREFDVFLVEKNQLANIFKLNTYDQ